MSIQNFPTALQPIIQRGFLARAFEKTLQGQLGYRDVADREDFPNKVGETITKTRRGLKAPTTTALVPSANTNLDNGLSPSAWTVEQYTLSINMYGDTIDLNTVNEGVGIASQFVANAEVNARQAAQSVDRLARQALFSAYMSGNTFINSTLGAPAAVVSVDDITGFTTVLVPGTQFATPSAVSSGNPLPITINGTVYNVISAAADVTNISYNAAAGGISGKLTLSGNASIVNATLGNAVISSVAPTVVRPNNKSSSNGLSATTDLLLMSTILSAVTVLRNNAVPKVNGRYLCFIDPTSAFELFQDPAFQLLYRGTGTSSQAYQSGEPIDMLDVRFVPTNEAYLSVNAAGVVVHRPIIVGKGALVEGDFANLGNTDTKAPNSIIDIIDGIAMVTRAPLDRLQQIIAQSWYTILGFAVPTDITATQTIIPTANAAYYKRAVVIEHG
jgi:hypothetical protein